ncbi:MAG: FeoC-like transcriptional regulator [Moraxellaceae bacterium]|nr:FeoC-like transcriptional regulator [Moraxellaceae bacterium]
MDLLSLRDYLQSHGRTRIGDLAVHFNTQTDAVRFALIEWERRGRVRKLQEGGAGGGCGGSGGGGKCANCCGGSSDPMYEWVS